MPKSSQIILVLGGARSGKSTFAERLAASLTDRVTYLATAQAYDDEMRARIKKHQADRPVNWMTVECPIEVAAAIRTHATETNCFLLDCMTLWTSNMLMTDEATAEQHVPQAVAEILAAVRETGSSIIIVSNEVGLGLVPEYPLGRIYRDVLGRANQQIAAEADAVYYLIAGLPLDVKSLACSPFAEVSA